MSTIEDPAARSLAAEYVASCRINGRKLARFPREWGVKGLDAAYAVQALANKRLAEELGAPAGLKLGGTTQAMRDLINVPEALLGEVFGSTVYESGSVLRLQDYHRLGIESEIAVVLSKSLHPEDMPLDREQAWRFVGAVIPAIEIVDDRYDDFRTIGAETQIADNIFNAGSILGPRVGDWERLPWDRLVCQTVLNGIEVAKGKSDALLGHPLDALLFALQRWAKLDRRLPEGALISLGTITQVQWIDEPCVAEISVDGLGRVSVELV